MDMKIQRDIIMKRLQRHKKLIVTILALWIIGTGVSFIITSGEWLFYDARNYWKRGIRLWTDNKFSLLNMQDGFRGYVYPLYLGICNRIGGKSAFIIINSLLIVVFMTVIVPRLHEFNGKKGVKSIIHYLLFAFLFVGLIAYPLSDLFAIVLCSVGIMLEKKLEKSSGFLRRMVLSIALGGVMYLTYNVRTIYLFANAVLVIKFIVYSLKRQKMQMILLSIVGEGIGVALAAVPQLYMNYFNLGIISIKVPTHGLMLQQVFWGIQYQRYDTYVGTAMEHPDAPMYFLDPVGSRLLLELGIESFGSWKEFLFLCLKYPVEVFGIYIRHFVNMLLPCWPNQYVMELNNCKILLAILALLMFWVFGLGALNKFISVEYLRNYIVLLTPVVFITPGAVEVRFFAALYIMVIGALCYNMQWGKLKEYVLGNKVKVSVCFVMYVCIMVSIWSAMLASDPCCGIYFG